MVKRMAWLLALVCLFSTALADGTPLSTDLLPQCYRYPIAGANVVYADAPVPVYDNDHLAGMPVGYVNPGQNIAVQQIHRGENVVFIQYSNDPAHTDWRFAKSAPTGWINAIYITIFTQVEPPWVVTTDKPGNRLNLRAEPSHDSVSLGKFYAGSIVRQIAPSKDGFVKVRTPHLTGYMDLRYLEPGLYTPTAELPILTVISDSGIQLRKLPQSGSEVIKIVPSGAQVTALAVRYDDWVLVIYENETGYTQGRYVTPRLIF